MVEVKICAICNGEINPDKDNYVRITDYSSGVLLMEKFYHTLCYNRQLKGTNPQQKVAMTMLDKAHKLLDRVQGEPEKVYEIK